MTQAQSFLPPIHERLLTVKQVAAVVGLAPRTIWRWISSNRFPAPDVAEGHRVRRWKYSSIINWMSVKNNLAVDTRQENERAVKASV